MKRIVVFIIVGLVMFGAGFGGGLMLGRTMAANVAGGADAKVPPPGPVVSIGDFTCNLAGSGRHIINIVASLEVLNAKAEETISLAAWHSRIRNEILLIVKDKIYEDLTSAEGMLQLSEEIKRSLNALLPQINGEAPVVRVMFDTFIIQ